MEKKEFSSLLITLMSAKLLLSYPLRLVKNSGPAAWIQVIFVTLLALLIFRMTVSFYERKINIIDLIKSRLGKTAGVAAGLIVFGILFLNMMSITRIFPESVQIVLLQNTESDVTAAVFALTILIGAYLGIEALAQINYIFLPICGILLIVFVALLFPYYDISNLMPILGTGAFDVFVKGINGLSIFSDIIVLNILLAYSKNINEARDCGTRAIIISGAVALITTLIYSLIYPYPTSEKFILPMYQVTRMIHLTSFFNRFEAVFQFIWSILAFLYGAVYIYLLCFVWQTTFGLKYLKPLIFPMVLLIMNCAMIPESIMEADIFEGIFNAITSPAAFLMPIIAAVIEKKTRQP